MVLYLSRCVLKYCHMQNSFQEKEGKRPQKISSSVEIIKTLIIAFVIVIPVRIFIAQPFIVSGSSMDPTFKNGDYLIIDELSYRIGNPDRLDVVIFKYPKKPSTFFIKRIIGLPGESISINNGAVTVTAINGESFILDDSYVKYPKTDQFSITLGNSEYFVLGDNRAESSDSRIWGPLDERFLVGKAFLRLFPINAFDFKPGLILKNN